MSDQLWRRLSSSLDSNQRIYGYRVDATHNHTYRILESLAHQKNKEEKEELEGSPTEPEQTMPSSLNTGWEDNGGEEDGLDGHL